MPINQVICTAKTLPLWDFIHHTYHCFLLVTSLRMPSKRVRSPSDEPEPEGRGTNPIRASLKLHRLSATALHVAHDSDDRHASRAETDAAMANATDAHLFHTETVARSVHHRLYEAAQRTPCYVSAIDTRKLNNAILHVPSMQFLSESEMMQENWELPHEYLAHGKIHGPGLRSAPLSVFHAVLPRPAWPGRWRYDVVFQSRKFKNDEIAAACQVGEMYGEDFVVAVTVAILCQKPRARDLWRSGKITDLEKVVHGLSGCKIPRRLCCDATILINIVHKTGYKDVEQMIRLLRALVNWHHGKGSRGRSRSRARSVPRPTTYVRERSSGKEKSERRVRFDKPLSVDSDEEDERGWMRLRMTS